MRACPKCGSTEAYARKSRPGWICKKCTRNFTDTSCTILHSRKMPVEKYAKAFEAFKRGASSTEVAGLIDCNYRTAWRLRRLAIMDATNGNS